MKQTIFFIILAWVLIIIPNASAMETSNRMTNEKMQETVYGATIDSKVAFYQKRLYLVDSEFKILAEIGQDAARRVAFLKNNRQALINTMTSQNIKLEESKLNSFIGRKMVTIGTTMEAYSSE